MPTKAPTPCLACGALGLCTHRRATQGRNTKAYQRHRTNVLAKWRAIHGDWCPGYDTPAHTATDLTVDHTTPIAHGGWTSPLTVLCRSCNSRRGAIRSPDTESAP